MPQLENSFIVGDCSTGKTSLAVTIGNEAVEKGARVIYIKFDDLLEEQKLKKKIWIMMFLHETKSLILITNSHLVETLQKRLIHEA